MLTCPCPTVTLTLVIARLRGFVTRYDELIWSWVVVIVLVVFCQDAGTGAALAWAAGNAAPSRATMAMAIRNPFTSLVFTALILCVLDFEDKPRFEMLGEFIEFITQQ